MSSSSVPERSQGKPAEVEKKGGFLDKIVTLGWATPGFAWLALYLIAPLVFIVLVSFWTYEQGVRSGFTTDWTLQNYVDLFNDSTYWNNMLSSFMTSVIAVFACLVFGFPVAYFLAMKVQSLKYQIALFIIALAPFWTSFLTRSIAWTYPLMGREGALNQVLTKLGIVDEPVQALGFSTLSVRLRDGAALHPLHGHAALLRARAGRPERARGGARPRRERLEDLPRGRDPAGDARRRDRLDLHLRADDGGVRTVRVIGGNTVSSVGTIVQSKVEIGIQYPQGAASAVLLVVALIVGVLAITRVSNLREEI